MYPAHGAGRVAAREKRVVLGAVQEVIVLALADGLSVTLPMQLARELLRPLVSEAGLHRVQETLREDGALSGDVWLKRMKQVQAKLRAGRVVSARRPPRVATLWESIAGGAVLA